ncbi:uncharacterized protein LOC133323915 [Musca vetustissima]|uniref:uncharacterized protein LOC133323915 n=1 Tax=Musca vetustissima TaxID=27455 RepID=UPI002AB6B798|nr:uncharacterized protein LOC133323915 [Musca vetustissima]
MYLHLISLMAFLLADSSKREENTPTSTVNPIKILKKPNQAQDCVDSRLRAGRCVTLAMCPDMVQEYYDEIRKTSYAADFQTFMSNSICGFDGMNFLICCGTSHRTTPPSKSQMIMSFSTTPTPAYPSKVFLFSSLGNYNSNTQTLTTQPPAMLYPQVSYPGVSNTPTTVYQPQPQPPVNSGGTNVYQPIPQQPVGPIILTTPRPTSPVGPTNQLPPSQATMETCGISRGNTNRVVGGTEARRGAYPWMAALGYRDELNPTTIKFLCGGSLISSKYVLTSAHCINTNLILVRLGAHDLSNPAEPNAADYSVRRTKVHEEFDLRTIANDIALIEVSPNVVMTSKFGISPICLPESSTFLTQDFVGMNPFVAGWGANKHQGITSNVLMDVQVPIVSRQSCEQSYRTIFNFVQFSDKVICAGNSNVDACQGDSGGPLMMPQLVGSTYRYFLLGTVSYGYECARTGFPGVYTRVAVYMPWIKQNMIYQRPSEHFDIGSWTKGISLVGLRPERRSNDLINRILFQFEMLSITSILWLITYCVCWNGCWGHRGFINGPGPSNGGGGSFCQTPLGDMGSCVSLKYCPEVLTLFQRLDTNSAKQYSSELQRRCGNRLTYDQYPVLCCKHVVMTPMNESPSDTHKRSGGVTTTTSTTTTTTEAPTSNADRTANKNSNSANVLCLTTESTSGLCKPLRECSQLLQQLQANPDNEDIKAKLRRSHDRCGNENTMVCCPTEDNGDSDTTTNRRNINRRQMTNQQNTPSLPSEEDGCGLVNQTAPKIVGGDESQIGAWPWMALIGYDPYSVRPFKCGGTLISNRHVITAAHCIRRDLSFVRLGEFDLSSETETTYLDVNVVKHSTHPQFGKNRRSDLAILLLETIVQFTDLIAPICMPNSEQLRSKSYVNSMPFVAGWGNTEQGGTSSQVLKETQLPVQANEVCRQIYKRLVPSVPDEDYGDAIICAGYTVGGTDTCQGDSGGPLMIPELYKGITRYYLIGVVSYGHGCGKVPGIYISTQHHMDWISEQIEKM